MSDQSLLGQLVSEAGIDLRVTRKEFRLALEQGCRICVPFSETFRVSISESKNQPFWVFDDEDPSNDGDELVRNYYAATVPEGGPFDIEEMIGSPLGASERDYLTMRYHVYADKGKIFPPRLKPFL